MSAGASSTRPGHKLMGRLTVHQARPFARGRTAAIIQVMCQDTPDETPAAARAFDEALVSACAKIGVSLEARQREEMLAHFRRMVETNRHFNLTRVTSASDAAVKHYADSLTLLAAPWVDSARPLNVLDIGTGAGFPAVPLAIMCPQWRILAIDGTGKKTRFVSETAEALGLANLQARHARVEQLDKSGGGPFDLILMRAVGKIAEVLPEAGRLLSAAGKIVFYKTSKIEPAEVSEGVRAAVTLGLSMADPFDIELSSPAGPLHRRLIRFEKAGSASRRG